LIAAGPSAPPHTAAALPAALQQRIAQLHADYARAYRSDAQRTIDDFNKTRADLTRRFDALAATDAAAAQSAQSEIADLQKKHDALYAQMVAQIDREVKTIAQQRGVSIVVDSIAPAGGVDLTDDAMKDIESLHE
jgi:Skp family chaperone for outer membrane proteins